MDEVRRILHCEDAEVTGHGVRIAIIDTGIDETHPDLTNRIDRKSSRAICLTLQGALTDHNGHGTHIAGIIAGSGASSGGRYRGIAPGAELIVLKAIAATGAGLDSDVAKAVFHAVDVGVDIINYSGGEAAYRKAGNPPWKWSRKLGARDEAFHYAVQKGVLVVAAAGNEGSFGRGVGGELRPASVIRPGNLQEVLCVGATSPPAYLVSPHSGRGPIYLDERLPRGAVVSANPAEDPAEKYLKPDIVAPGGAPLDRAEISLDPLIADNVWHLGPTSTRSRSGSLPGIDPLDAECMYARQAGTSQATAVVSGLSALLLEWGRKREFKGGSDPGAWLRAVIRDAARPLPAGAGHDFGYGVVQWPWLKQTLEDCLTNEVVRERVLHGRQLRLEI